MSVISLTSTPISDGEAIGLSQSLGGAGNFTINGNFASGGTADFSGNNTECRVQVLSTMDDSSLTFTFTGTDAEGNAVTEAVAGQDSKPAKTTKYFSTVTQVSSSGATNGNVTIGSANDSVTRFLFTDLQRNINLTTFSVELSETNNLQYSMQVAHTEDPQNDEAPFVTFDPRLTSLRKSAAATGSTPGSGYRIRTTEHVEGSLTFRIRQAGT